MDSLNEMSRLRATDFIVSPGVYKEFAHQLDFYNISYKFLSENIAAGKRYNVLIFYHVVINKCSGLLVVPRYDFEKFRISTNYLVEDLICRVG